MSAIVKMYIEVISAGIDKFEVGGSKWDIFGEVRGLRDRSGVEVRQKSGRVEGIANIVLFLITCHVKCY